MNLDILTTTVGTMSLRFPPFAVARGSSSLNMPICSTKIRFDNYLLGSLHPLNIDPPSTNTKITEWLIKRDNAYVTAFLIN